jgi:lipopolysaccharide/colanic/teichoic acid biosynthesis glycosyltransferase
MGTAVSHFGTGAAPRGRSGEHGLSAVKGDVAVELTAGPFADSLFAGSEMEQAIPRERSELASRALNIVVSLVALIVTSPILLLVALAVRLTSRGPILYSQVRVGVDRRFREKRIVDRRGYDYGGRLFKMYKFRSMTVDAEPDGRAVGATRRDPRTTPVGKILRKTRLDELPQLYNVLRGDMNIVGPRPERPTIFAKLREDIPEYAQRQRVKPGITGWAQVKGWRGETDTYEKIEKRVEHDLYYVENWSLGFDLKILVLTAFALIKSENAY